MLNIYFLQQLELFLGAVIIFTVATNWVKNKTFFLFLLAYSIHYPNLIQLPRQSDYFFKKARVYAFKSTRQRNKCWCTVLNCAFYNFNHLEKIQTNFIPVSGAN